MKIITYSDLHLEFGTDFKPPVDSDADLMILSGDIITFRDYLHLSELLEMWRKPVLYVAGNHEYYGAAGPIAEENKKFELWLADNSLSHPHLYFLDLQELFYHLEFF